MPSADGQINRPVPTLIHDGRAWVRAEHYDALLAAIRAALDTMNATDRELGEGGIARRAYADLYHAYFAPPSDQRATPDEPGRRVSE